MSTGNFGPLMKSRVTAVELAEITGVSENTIRRTARELLELLRQGGTRIE
jgi:transcription initiation factor TFIIIB Brf1 subunit/transcription initiation factor TFIIB